MQAESRPAWTDSNVEQSLRAWLDEQSDLTLAELAGRLEQTHGIRIGLPQLCRLLQKMGLPQQIGLNVHWRQAH